MPDLTPAEQFIWDWEKEILGGFKKALLYTIQQADPHSLEKLRLGFPDEVEGYNSYRYIPGWWDAVKKKMEKAHG